MTAPLIFANPLATPLVSTSQVSRSQETRFFPKLSRTTSVAPLFSGITPQGDTAVLRFLGEAAQALPQEIPLTTPNLSPEKFLASLTERIQALVAQEENLTGVPGHPGTPTDERMNLASEVYAANKRDLIAELSEVVDLSLQKKWSSAEAMVKTELSLKALKALIGPQGEGNIAIAQINTQIGAIEANGNKVLDYYKAAEAVGVDAVVFPELTLMSYAPQDVIARTDLVVRNVEKLKEIAKQTGSTTAYVGFVEPRVPEPGQPLFGRPFYNSIAILQHGEIKGIVRKCLLPNYGEFDDWRQFQPSEVAGVIPPEYLDRSPWIAAPGHQPVMKKPPLKKISSLTELYGKKVGINICEDGWNNKAFFKSGLLYQKDPVAELAKLKPDFLINASASPSRTRKGEMKNNMFSTVAKQYGIPYLMVNQIGANNEIIFDGASCLYDKNGKLIARAKSFEEQFMIVNPYRGEGKVYPLPGGLMAPEVTEKKFTLDYSDAELARSYDAIILGIRDFFKKTGQSKAALGLSGGLDSTVSALLLKDALGADNVIGLSLPYKITSKESKDDARNLAESMGVLFYEQPIQKVVDAFAEGLHGIQQYLETQGWGIYSSKLKDAADKAIQTLATEALPVVKKSAAWRLLSAAVSPVTWVVKKIARGIQKLLSFIPVIGGRFSQQNPGAQQTSPQNTSQASTPFNPQHLPGNTNPNAQARSRATFIWGTANLGPGILPIATSDKSELYMGYATVNGDMSGGLAPIADIPKSKLFALLEWIKRNKAQENPQLQTVIDKVLEKRPGAELEIDPKTGKPLAAEDDMMPYPFLDELIWRFENLNLFSVADHLKMPFQCEQEHRYMGEARQGMTISDEQKTEWIQKFQKRLQAAVFKWWLLPPALIVDARDITKTAYRHSITTEVFAG